MDTSSETVDSIIPGRTDATPFGERAGVRAAAVLARGVPADMEPPSPPHAASDSRGIRFRTAPCAVHSPRDACDDAGRADHWPSFAEGFNYLGLIAMEREDHDATTAAVVAAHLLACRSLSRGRLRE